MNPFTTRPAAAGAAAFFACCVLLSYADPGILSVPFVICAAVIACFVVIFCICRKSKAGNRDLRLTVISVAVCTAFSALFCTFNLYPRDLSVTFDETVNVRGVVRDKMWGNDSFASYKLELYEIAGGESDLTVIATSSDPALEVGDVIGCECVFLSFEDAELSEMERYLRSEGIGLCAEISAVKLDGAEEGLFTAVTKMRRVLSGRILAFTDGEGGALINSLLTGDRSGLSQNVRLDFQRLGISHLLAISGIHMSVIFASLSILLTPLGRRRQTWLVIPLIVLYMGISGFHASVVRSGTMLIGTCALQAYGRHRDPFSLLGVCVAAIALWDPNVFFDTGFILSVLSVAGVLLVGELSVRRKSGGDNKKSIPRRIAGAVLSSVAVTVAASLFTMPVICAEFGTMSFLAPLSNIIFIPAVTLLLYTLPVFVLTLPFPFIAAWLAQPLEAWASLILDCAGHMASFDGITFSVRYPFFIPLSLVGIVGAFLLLMKSRRRFGAVVLAISCSLCVVSAAVYEFSRRDSGSVTAITRSNEDILCVTDGGVIAMIDMTSGGSRTAGLAIEKMEEMCFAEVDHYILTHYHSRHPVMIQKLLSNIHVKTLWIPDPITKDELEIAAEIVSAAGDTRVKVIGDGVVFGELEYTPGGRCWISRSAEALHSFSLRGYGRAVTYYSSGYFDSSEEFRSDRADGDVIVYGSHGAKDLNEIIPPEEAELIVFLGDSTEYFPAEEAMRLSEEGCVFVRDGYTFTWRREED